MASKLWSVNCKIAISDEQARKLQVQATQLDVSSVASAMRLLNGGGGQNFKSNFYIVKSTDARAGKVQAFLLYPNLPDGKVKAAAIMDRLEERILRRPEDYVPGDNVQKKFDSFPKPLYTIKKVDTCGLKMQYVVADKDGKEFAMDPEELEALEQDTASTRASSFNSDYLMEHSSSDEEMEKSTDVDDEGFAMASGMAPFPQQSSAQLLKSTLDFPCSQKEKQALLHKFTMREMQVLEDEKKGLKRKLKVAENDLVCEKRLRQNAETRCAEMAEDMRRAATEKVSLLMVISELQSALDLRAP